MSAEVAQPARRLRRIERPALAGVLAREIINFSSYWRSTTVLEPCRADDLPDRLRVRFGSIVSTVGGYDYVEFVGTGTVATAVLFSSAFAAMFGTFIKYQFAHLRCDPRRARGHGVSSSPPRSYGSRRGPAVRLRAAARGHPLRA